MKWELWLKTKHRDVCQEVPAPRCAVPTESIPRTVTWEVRTVQWSEDALGDLGDFAFDGLDIDCLCG